MRYYKIIDSGYLDSLGTGDGGIEIAEDEYNDLLALIRDKPTAPAGYDYWITESGEYELVEAEARPEPSDEDELTDDEVLAILLGGDGV